MELLFCQSTFQDGFTDVLIEEMYSQGGQVFRHVQYEEGGANAFFVASRDFVHLPPLETNFQYPYMTGTAGLFPSPDWFTGFYSFWLINENTATWYDHIKIQTYPWDAGTDSGDTYLARDSDLDPQLQIERFRNKNNVPPNGEFFGPSGDEVPVVAEWECFLVVGDEPLILPECDYFANPCCNETDKVNCGNKLPNGATPELSPEYMEVIGGGGGSGAAMTGLSVLSVFAGFLIQWILA